jgi:Mannosyltransferase (PIG-V)
VLHRDPEEAAATFAAAGQIRAAPAPAGPIRHTSRYLSPDDRGPRAERSWWLALRYCGSVYLVVRAGLWALAAGAWGLTNEPGSITPDRTMQNLTNGWHNAFTGWSKFDALWFLEIAQHGYGRQNGSAAFYPGYPLLIRAVSYLCFGHLLVAAYIVSNAALLAALVVFYQLTCREHGAQTARRAVLYLAIFPTAFFFYSAYSEALFLLCAVASLSLARSGRWIWAGIAGVAATFTRSFGVVLVIALAVEALQQALEERRSGSAGRSLHTALAVRLGASLLPLAGVCSYLLYWQLRFHDWYSPIRVENTSWDRRFSPPWLTFWRGLEMALRYAFVRDSGWLTFDFLLVALGLVLGIWVATRERLVYAVYTWGSILFFLSETWPGRPLTSDPRYLLSLFPLVWPLARWGRRAGVHQAVVGLSAASLAIAGWVFVSTNLIFLTDSGGR